MAIDTMTLSAAKSYVKKSLEGAGALKGQKGDPGKDAPTIVNADVDENNVLSVTLSDGTSLTCGTIKTTNGQDGIDGITPHIDSITKHWFIGSVDTGIVAEGIKGEKGLPGNDGQQGIQGVKGDKGDDGYPFLIYKEYLDISDFNSSDFPVVGLMFMIKKENTTDFPVYRYTGDEINPYSYITSLSDGEAIKGDKGDPGKDGAQGIPGKDGIDGITYQPVIGTVVAGNKPAATIEVDENNSTAKFNFVLPKGDVGAKGDPGRSITSITTDEKNNVIVTFSDGSSQNIGSLSINVEANFLTESGFGNLRYYQGKLEYYNTETQMWVETSVTPDNVYIFNMIPQNMRHICGVYDVDAGHYKLMFEEPADTVIDGQVVCVVEKVIICRKLGSNPVDENDGTLVATITRPNFGMYKNSWYEDKFFSPNMGEEWYYSAFPVSTTGFVNVQQDNSTGRMVAKDYYLFGFKIDQNEIDSSSMITYIADNKKFKSAFMDYDVDIFNYGSWNDVFFIPHPCMLNNDGTVEYYLNQDDYTLKKDGTPSDIGNTGFSGNAMVEFNKIFWKSVNNDDGTACFYFSNKKVDDDFKCWSNIDANGDEIDHFYLAIYDGSLHNGALRSLSGFMPLTRKTRQQELNYAHENNSDDIHIYDTLVMCDHQLLVLLHLLISGTTDSQTAFGYGNNNSYVSTSKTGILKTGTFDKKGMFYGTQNDKDCVKTFGIENPWGNIWKSCAGWISDHGIQKVKLTYGQSDSSTVDGYNITGDGYIEIEDATLYGTDSGFLSVCKFTEYGIIPNYVNGSSTTSYCDAVIFNNDQKSYANVGGGSIFNNMRSGILATDFKATSSTTYYTLGAVISCKPLAAIQNRGNSL